MGTATSPDIDVESETLIMLVCASTGPTTTSDSNSNKFHKFERTGPGMWRHTYGRVGTPGVSKDSHDSKVRAKVREALTKGGYRRVELAAEGGGGGKVSAPTDKAGLRMAAVDQIAKGDPGIEKLVRRLVDRNVHAITKTTSLNYNAATGLFSTALGVVTRKTVDEARLVLEKAQKSLKLSTGYGSSKALGPDEIAAEYLMLIPTAIGRDRPTFQRIFPDMAAIQAQSAILDSLIGSLDMLEKTPAAPAAKAKAESVWDVTLQQITDPAELARIDRKFQSSKNIHHGRGANATKVVNAWTLSIAQMASQFQAYGKNLGNVMELWHGTAIGNVLSILSKGLIIPRSASNGRMFGDGVYFSDQSTKSLQYTQGDNEGAFLFLADVAMGKAHTPSSGWGSFPVKGYDSTFAEGGKSGVYNNEMIVYDLRQCSITRLVEVA